MRSLRFDPTAFITAYNQALEDGINQTSLAAQMGLTYSCFCCRKHALRKRGIHLPGLPRKAGSGRPPAGLARGGWAGRAAKPVVRLITPVQIDVEPAPLTFTMTVSCQ